MKLKYYLRGLGIGIFVTTLIFGISASGRKTLSDEEVKARALELGMVEESLLSDAQSGLEELQATTEVNTEISTESRTEVSTDGTSSEETTKKDSKEADSESDEEKESDIIKDESDEIKETADANSAKADVAMTNTDSAKSDATGNDANLTDNKDNTTIESADKSAVVIINSGDGSYTVSKKLAEAGLVSSATAYDAYLCSHGYDKKIITGNHTITSGATEEDIAKVITSSN